MDHDVAEVRVRDRQRYVLGRRPRQEQVVPVVLVGDAEVVRLHAVFGTDREFAAQQVRGGRFQLRPVAVVAITAEAEDADLVRLGQAQRVGVARGLVERGQRGQGLKPLSGIRG